MTKGFKDKEGKFRPTTSTPRKRATQFITQNPNTQSSKVDNSELIKRKSITIDNLTLMEFRDHPMFVENVDWLDVLVETPEVIVADESRERFFIWFGGESHTVHEYTPNGVELDVFTFGFEKNRLDKSEVLEQIQKRIEEPVDEE